jgi:hypothetical protein
VLCRRHRRHNAGGRRRLAAELEARFEQHNKAQVYWPKRTEGVVEKTSSVLQDLFRHPPPSCFRCSVAVNGCQKGATMNLNVTKTMVNARHVMTDGAFQQAASLVSDAKNVVREEMQRKTSSKMRTIIDNLESGEPITAEDIMMMKAWIVGDAEGYTEMENNFHDWLSEYDRLEASLAGYEGRDCSSEDLSQLYGILEDATRISYDIATFLEKQDRMKRFDSAMTDGLNEDERNILARTLTEKLRSSNC